MGTMETQGLQVFPVRMVDEVLLEYLVTLENKANHRKVLKVNVDRLVQMGRKVAMVSVVNF